MNNDHISATLARLTAMATAEDYDQGLPDSPPENKSPSLKSATGFGERYAPAWGRPQDDQWQGDFSTLLATVQRNAIAVLVGERGTGKTRLSAEVAREISPDLARYETAMGLFLKIRGTFTKQPPKGSALECHYPDTEKSIVDALTSCPLLILDEIQERGGTEWEDRLLTHIIDRRYARLKPSILIANLQPGEAVAHLGASIADRIRESGGIIRVEGRSHRAKPDPNGTKRPEAANLPPSIPAMPSESSGRVETAERGSERATGLCDANAIGEARADNATSPKPPTQ